MSKQTINIGTAADDGTGETTRNAFDKCNDNFDELYTDVSTLQSDVSALEIVTENAETDDYVLILTDANKLVSVGKGTACTLTVPPNSSVAFPVGTMIIVAQTDAGQVTITAGVGVTINSYDSALKLVGQYATCSLTKTATNTWLCSGNLEA